MNSSEELCAINSTQKKIGREKQSQRVKHRSKARPLIQSGHALSWNDPKSIATLVVMYFRYLISVSFVATNDRISITFLRFSDSRYKLLI